MKICSIGSINWDINTFCKGWLITGATGAGKTISGIGVLLHQVFINCSGAEKGYPKWGGVCIDEKGSYAATLRSMTEHYGRKEDLKILSISENAEDLPPVRLNLIGDLTVRPKTYAEALVKASEAVNGGAKNSDTFFRDKTIFCIALAIELIFEIYKERNDKGLRECRIGLDRVGAMLSSKEGFQHFLKVEGLIRTINTPIPSEQDECLADESFKSPSGEIVFEEITDPVIKSKRIDCLLEEFENKMWCQPGDQLGGVLGTIANCLSHFSADPIINAFCRDSTFNFSDIDQGKIVCVSIPQSFSVERRYISATLKFLFYNHALRRFDYDENTLIKKNLLILWQDEGQRFFSEDDCNTDVIRQARATTVIATQSTTSLYAQLNNEKKTDATILNLRNRIIFQSSDATCAEVSSRFLGEKRTKNRTQSIGPGGKSTSISTTNSPAVSTAKLRGLKPHCAYISPGNNSAPRHYIIEPLDVNGDVPSWWPKFLLKKYPFRWIVRVFLGRRGAL
tara:strand:- start:2445 stop:3971 length:1527 start_codon:yes stop_codon:yes gene_type:complete